MQRTVCIAVGRGCPRTYVDLARLRSYFEANSWVITRSISEADVIVMSTCGYVQEEEDMSLSYLKSIRRRQKTGAALIATGCLARLDPDRLASEYAAIPYAPSTEREIDDLIGASVPLSSVCDPPVIAPTLLDGARSLSGWQRFRAYSAVPERLPIQGAMWLRKAVKGQRKVPSYLGDDCFHIRVSKGCASECTYCVIRKAAGEQTSKPLARIQAEFQAAMAAGASRIRLVSEDVGAYGIDLGLSVVDLLRCLFETGPLPVCWDDFGPRWLIQHFTALAQLVASHPDRIIYAGFPVQSGSDRILGLMNRGHSAADVERCLTELRRVAPSLPLRTHVLVGFPGETRADFRKTLQLVHSVGFAEVASFVYSDRDGTVASGLPGHVPGVIKLARNCEFRCRFRAVSPKTALSGRPFSPTMPVDRMLLERRA
jgi:tRNA A37 methylthiotransferase MiaB